MNARDELAEELAAAYGESPSSADYDAADHILAAGYQKPEVRVKWAAAHAENGVVYNAYPTRDEAQEFIDSMAEVGHGMVLKRCEHTLATHTAWETYEPEDD